MSENHSDWHLEQIGSASSEEAARAAFDEAIAHLEADVAPEGAQRPQQHLRNRALSFLRQQYATALQVRLLQLAQG